MHLHFGLFSHDLRLCLVVSCFLLSISFDSFVAIVNSHSWLDDKFPSLLHMQLQGNRLGGETCIPNQSFNIFFRFPMVDKSDVVVQFNKL